MKIQIRAVIFCGFLIISMWSIGKLYGEITGNAFLVPAQARALDNRTPTCRDRGNISEEELHWLYIPNNPIELATHEYYGYLSGKLIQTGAGDASDCPLNGVWLNGYANACGLEKTREESLHLQNVYDDEILAVGRDIGVPPIMIKYLKLEKNSPPACGADEDCGEMERKLGLSASV